MEEIKCTLTGFSSNFFEYEASPGVIAHFQQDDHLLIRENNHHKTGKDTHRINRESCLFQSLHPAEQNLLAEVLPLGEQYDLLQEQVRRTLVGEGGGKGGLYRSAVSMGVQQILGHYRESVELCTSPSALRVLKDTYGLSFQLLTRLYRVAATEVTVQQVVGPSSSTTGQLLHADIPLHPIEDFLAHQEVPRLFRQWVGQSVWLSLLHTIAHYVSHGVVLYGRDSFFVHVRQNPDTGEEEHTLHTDKLPRCISVDLGTLIVRTGKERRAVLNASMVSDQDYLERLALGAQDEAAETVFQAVFHPSLCVGGLLAADDLAARVTAARTLWSKALWQSLGSTASLHRQLHALRDLFLCQRGDLWSTFSTRLFDLYFSQFHSDVPPSRPVTLSRAAAEAYLFAFSSAGLVDKEDYSAYRLVVSADGESQEGSQSVEGVAQRMLERAADIGLQYAVPKGLQLVVSSKALTYYQRLFSLYLTLRLATEAVQACRPAVKEATLLNRDPSGDLRYFISLYQQLQFLCHHIQEYLQVDVLLASASALTAGLTRCSAVEEARRLHDRFLWETSEGSFLTEGAEPLLNAIRAVCLYSFAVYTLCGRYRLVYWAVKDVNETPPEVRAALGALQTRLQQEVTVPLVSHLSMSRQAKGSSLWTRLDFSRYYSQHHSSLLTTLQSSAGGSLYRNPYHTKGNEKETLSALARPSIHSQRSASSGALRPPESSHSERKRPTSSSRHTRTGSTVHTNNTTNTISASTVSAITGMAAASNTRRNTHNHNNISMTSNTSSEAPPVVRRRTSSLTVGHVRPRYSPPPDTPKEEQQPSQERE
ncbi:tubulin, gamma complex associated protein 4 [Angomonas deanei]|nr:tubulin, gamma complex associated protein 4 [Angomonas deanei]|eukprot:EPY43679.1 tubulin, gamma complex associated protein 4 [Angomonas deanei]